MKFPNDRPLYYNLLVKHVIKETKDCVSVVFHHPENEKINYKPGQFLTLIFRLNNEEVRRAYSLSSSPFVDPDLSVTVKRVEKGILSNWIVDHLKEGERVRVMAPAGKFTTDFHPAHFRHLIMFAGGSGITPIRSIILSLLAKEPNSICSLIYCNRDIGSIIFKDDLEKLQNHHPNRFRLFPILDNPPENWVGYGTRLSQDVVVNILDQVPNFGPQRTNFFLCGPEGMIRVVEDALASQTIPPTLIVKEEFTRTENSYSIKERENIISDMGHWITLRFNSQVNNLRIKHSSTILEAALENGIELPFSCKSGICTACRVKCVSGKVGQEVEGGLPTADLQAGYILTCVGRPLTDDVVIDADERNDYS